MRYIENYPSIGMSERTYNVIEESFYRHKEY